MTVGKAPFLLCVLDGFGLNPSPVANAVALANKPNFDRLFTAHPSTTLVTHGERVGLPEGQMGNSEVGHLNIGAGRVVEQWLLRISRFLRGDGLTSSSVYTEFRQSCSVAFKANGEHTIHLIGLYSEGGVHSHREHLSLLLKRLLDETESRVVIHLLTDGRDTPPQSALAMVKELEAQIESSPRVSIGTVCGRFFAMDRDKRWERVKASYDVIAAGVGAQSKTASEWLAQSYGKGITDEFIEACAIGNPGSAYSGVRDGDHVVYWNFREDRMREIVRALSIEEFDGFARSKVIFPQDKTLCFTDYDHSFHLPFLFEQLEIKNHLGEVVSKAGLAQMRIAETEKYPHVTYFFNGGIEPPYEREDRVMVPSPRDVKTYDQKPQMSAFEVTEKVLEGIESGKYDLIVLNFANCDMVGHTGVLAAAIQAVETVDQCLGRIIDRLLSKGGKALILADHGNAEQMVDYETSAPHTSHTKYPVPCVIVGVGDGVVLRKDGALCDVAPTVLKIIGVEQPREMTGDPLY